MLKLKRKTIRPTIAKSKAARRFACLRRVSKKLLELAANPEPPPDL
jgi:hypothetical protein